jgi:hypothetical protein
MNVVTLIGYALEACGLILAFFGLHRTFRQYAPDEGELDPLIRWIRGSARSGGARVNAWWRRLARRPGRVQEASVELSGTATLSGTLSVRKTYGYPRDRTIKDFVATMHARTQELMTRSDELSDKIAAETAAREEADGDLATRIEAESARLDAMTRDVAIGGVRIQLVGLSLVSIGLLLQGFGQALN